MQPKDYNIALLGKLIILKGRGKPHDLVISTWSKKKYARYIFQHCLLHQSPTFIAYITRIYSRLLHIATKFQLIVLLLLSLHFIALFQNNWIFVRNNTWHSYPMRCYFEKKVDSEKVLPAKT